MAWHGILGHDDVVERFRRALERGRLASSFLFVGEEGIGKRLFAFKLAQALLCPVRPEAAMDPCENCPPCIQVQALTHPDLEYVRKPDDKSLLPLELLIGDQEHRGREGLCHRMAMKPFMGGRKVAIIDDADYLNPEGANCLLKTLEEPPRGSALILLGTSAAKQLPTIRSRCQLIRFQPLKREVLAGLLAARGLVPDGADAEDLAQRSGGSVQRAIKLADPELRRVRELVHERLADPRFDGVTLAAELGEFVEQAGKEAAMRRERLRHLTGFAVEFYGCLLRRMSGAPAEADEHLAQRAEAALRHWSGDTETAADCVQRCLEAGEQIDRNVYPVTLLECWLDDLARACSPRPRPPR